MPKTEDMLSSLQAIKARAKRGKERGWRHGPNQGIKNDGWLGPMRTSDGGHATELSRSSFGPDGKEMHYPLMTPNLDKKEREYFRTIGGQGPPPESIEIKAKKFALDRIKKGKSPFWEDGDSKAEWSKEAHEATWARDRKKK